MNGSHPAPSFLEEEDPQEQPIISLSQMVIGSVDTLRGKEHDLRIGNEWNERPPLLQGPTHRRGGRPAEETTVLLKGLIRKGIPPALRCAVWLSNIIQAVHPHQEPNYWHEYRTLAKVRALDNAYEGLLCQVVGSGGGGSCGTSGTSVSSDHNNRSNFCSSSSEHGTTTTAGAGGGSSSHHSGGSSSTAAAKQLQQLNWNDEELWNSLDAPTFGQQQQQSPTIPDITPAGWIAHKRVLVALERVLAGVDFAPILPTLTAILLTVMSESYAFCAVREMSHQVDFYFPVSRRESKAWGKAFSDILNKLHKTTYSYLQDRGVFDDCQVKPFFQDLFVGLLPMQYVLRIMDIYTLEGSKVIYRFGVALLVLYKIHSSENLITISTADEWWNGLKAWAHSNQFDFDVVVRKSYGVHGKGIRTQMRFPRRHILQRIIKIEEERLQEEGDDGDEEYAEPPPPARPLGLSQPRVLSDEEEVAKSILAEPTQTRLKLAEWLPLTLRMTNLELLYSTNHHGRSLEMFYTRVKLSKHTILLCEAYPKKSSSNSKPIIIGMYASQAWRVSTQVYGDGGCFLFRLDPNPQCWKWKPRRRSNKKKTGGGGHNSSASSPLDTVDLDDENDDNNQTALLEQFMVSTSNYISMGGNEDGSAGLRFNEDFTTGESSAAAGFDNEPLHSSGGQQEGDHIDSVFDIGLVEVYGLVRQIDGRAA